MLYFLVSFDGSDLDVGGHDDAGPAHVPASGKALFKLHAKAGAVFEELVVLRAPAGDGLGPRHAALLVWQTHLACNESLQFAESRVGDPVAFDQPCGAQVGLDAVENADEQTHEAEDQWQDVTHLFLLVLRPQGHEAGLGRVASPAQQAQDDRGQHKANVDPPQSAMGVEVQDALGHGTLTEPAGEAALRRAPGAHEADRNLIGFGHWVGWVGFGGGQ